jgi:UDPglucose 6-dehydrogenase
VTDIKEAVRDAVFVLVATPTDYSPGSNAFDTSSVDAVVREALAANADCTVVVRSTVPVGHIRRLRASLGTGRILFSPEFLREGFALHDSLHPSRIIVGGTCERARTFAGILRQGTADKNAPVLFTDPDEAEAIKLFSNMYLAMRVAFFNELDSYALENGMNTRQIVEGTGLDPRIGGHYNNPSFGYGGYCLPKDTRQLLADYGRTPQRVMGAVVEANRTRKDFLANKIAAMNPGIVGIYRLVMHEGSDDLRHSATMGLMKRLQAKGVEIILYEPTLDLETFLGARVIQSLSDFKAKSGLIVANRLHEDLADVLDRVFTRDLAPDPAANARQSLPES